MTRRYRWNVLIFAAALAFLAGPSAFAQAKKQARRASGASPTKPASADRMADLGFGIAESLSGSVQMVVADQNLVVISGPNGVPYDLKITPKTVIVVGDHSATLETLAGQIGKPVSAGFVPQRNGNFATRIEISG